MNRAKTAIVTGSTSGIGLGIAQALARAGNNIVINGFGNVDEIKAITADLQTQAGVQVEYSNADMSRPEQISKMVQETERCFAAVDILVNNAGIQFVAPVDEFPDAKWEQILAINLSSNFYAIKAVLPGMKQRNAGRIVNIASAHGLVASPFKSAYVAAKHGVLGLTKAVALVATTPITCNAVCPGYVRTPLVEGQIADQAKAHNLSEEEVVRDVFRRDTLALISVDLMSLECDCFGQKHRRVVATRLAHHRSVCFWQPRRPEINPAVFVQL